MAEHEGYIKIDRNMLRWRWVNSPTTGWLFIILLLKANYKKMTFEGIEIQPGQVVTSYPSLVKSSGLSIQQCRSALKRLKSTGEVTATLYPKFQVITIVNYKQYQDATGKSTGRITGKQQASNRQPTSREIQVKQAERQERKKGRSAPDSPSGRPERGTDEFRNQSHLLLTMEEGEADDIPVGYRTMFKTFAEYWRYRNQ